MSHYRILPARAQLGSLAFALVMATATLGSIDRMAVTPKPDALLAQSRSILIPADALVHATPAVATPQAKALRMAPTTLA
jgi:hypothetical protein